MKITEIRDMADVELLDKIKDSRAELFNLRFQLATGQLDNPARIKDIKKDIARLLTEMRSRELNAASDAAAS
ncbi:MAG: 50S ribosomal protein L29 [Actinomycetota bacterium]|jgi:large subunit ribosomal protein L29|nr:50S ribosomal protein L29 [Actinomycetota bacterium]